MGLGVLPWEGGAYYYAPSMGGGIRTPLWGFMHLPHLPDHAPLTAAKPEILVPLYRSPNRRQHTAGPASLATLSRGKGSLFFLSIYLALLTRGSISGISLSFSFTVYWSRKEETPGSELLTEHVKKRKEKSFTGLLSRRVVLACPRSNTPTPRAPRAPQCFSEGAECSMLAGGDDSHVPVPRPSKGCGIYFSPSQQIQQHQHDRCCHSTRIGRRPRGAATTLQPTRKLFSLAAAWPGVLRKSCFCAAVVMMSRVQ